MYPQHHTAPETVTAQAWADPAATSTTVPVIPLTARALDPEESPAPSPNWPVSSRPKHTAAPATVTAQVNLAPPAARTADTADTAVGASLSGTDAASRPI